MLRITIEDGQTGGATFSASQRMTKEQARPGGPVPARLRMAIGRSTRGSAGARSQGGARDAGPPAASLSQQIELLKKGMEQAKRALLPTPKRGGATA